jgi:hypothetical protein
VVVILGLTVYVPEAVEDVKPPGLMLIDVALLVAQDKMVDAGPVAAGAAVKETTFGLAGGLMDPAGETHAEPFHCLTKTCRKEPRATSPQAATGCPFRIARDTFSALPCAVSAFSELPMAVQFPDPYLAT